MRDSNLTDARDLDHEGERRLEIEGVQVDAAFDEIYRQTVSPAKQCGVRLQFEVIAWEPLVVAADREALEQTLREVITTAACSAQSGTVTVRAFPSHDDVCATFEITDERPTSTDDGTRGWARYRRTIERMGGELAVTKRAHGGTRVVFWLPQWVTCDMSVRSSWLCAA